MALNIKNEKAERLARDLATETGESLTEAVTTALEERLAVVRRRRDRARVKSEIAEIQAFVASLPVLDTRPAEEILGYDEHGLPS